MTMCAFRRCQAGGREGLIPHHSHGEASRRPQEHPGRGGGFPLPLTFKFSPERRAKSAFETRPVWFRRADSLCKDLEAREPILGTETTAINNG